MIKISIIYIMLFCFQFSFGQGLTMSAKEIKEHKIKKTIVFCNDKPNTKCTKEKISTINIFNTLGYKIESISFSSNDSFQKKNYYSYDSLGNLVKITTKDKSGNILKKDTISFFDGIKPIFIREGIPACFYCNTGECKCKFYKDGLKKSITKIGDYGKPLFIWKYQYEFF